jgi:hypothetical protein
LHIDAKIRPCLGLLAALVLLGCSSDNVVVNSPAKVFAVPEWAKFQSTAKPVTGRRAVTADDLANADGQCSGADTTLGAAPPESAPPTAGAPGAPAAPGPGAAETRGVGLEMTECQVIRRNGHPDRVEIGADPGGQRATVLTYLQGVRPGIYHFVDGRLKQVERAPEPAAPEKPAKQPRRKPRTTATAN